jgi:hypothetical protein
MHFAEVLLQATASIIAQYAVGFQRFHPTEFFLPPIIGGRIAQNGRSAPGRVRRVYSPGFDSFPNPTPKQQRPCSHG